MGEQRTVEVPAECRRCESTTIHFRTDDDRLICRRCMERGTAYNGGRPMPQWERVMQHVGMLVVVLGMLGLVALMLQC